MPSAIELDTKRWSHVVPIEDEAVTVTARGFACYYSNEPQPPEKASEGTELTEGSSLTIENPSGRWFRAKEPSSTEVPFKPVILEVTAGPGAEGEQITTAMIDNLAITAGKLGAEAATAGKIGKEAVTAAKALKPQVLVASGTESLTAEVGTAGVARSVIAVYNAKKEASAKVKIKHELGTEYVAVTAWKASAKKATEKITDGAAVAGAISKVAMISANEIELTLVATEPAAKEELFYIITG